MTILQKARDKILTNATENYNFGDYEVAGMDGWEYTSTGKNYSRVVYLENEDNFSFKVFLTVVFKDVDNAEVQEIYAITQNGTVIGSFED